MPWIVDQFVDAIKSVFADAKQAALDFTNELFRKLLRPIVGTPAPESDTRYVVVGAPDNPAWQSLYNEVYLPYIVSLTVMLLIAATAYIGLRSGSMSPYRQKKMLRRIGIVFLGTLVWFPIVSVPLQFVNDLGMHLAPIDDMSSGLGSLGKAGIGGIFAGIVVALLSNLLLLIAALVYAIRWIGIWVLTTIMPFLGLLWAVEVWPLESLSGLGKRAASAYPGLVLAGIPAAVLFRIGWAIDFGKGFSAVFGLFIALALIPGACIASILTVWWSSSAIQRVSLTGAGAGMVAASKASKSRKDQGNGDQGAQEVHRGYSDNPPDSGMGGGQTSGSGGSTGHGSGSSSDSSHGNTGGSSSGSTATSGVRDKVKEEVSRAATAAKDVPKQALRTAKSVISRW